MAAKKKADAAVENTAEVTQETVQEEIEQVAADNARNLTIRSMWLTTYFQPSVREWKI